VPGAGPIESRSDEVLADRRQRRVHVLVGFDDIPLRCSRRLVAARVAGTREWEIIVRHAVALACRPSLQRYLVRGLTARGIKG
jgi:hypothetical protein